MPAERLTLVVTQTNEFAWNRENVLCVDSLPRMQATLGALDVERIILDRSATADEFLILLAELHDDVAGDLMLVREDGGGFLSASGRGGDRVLYALAPRDIEFYLETHALLFHRDALALTA